jgi:hypothetical protein
MLELDDLKTLQAQVELERCLVESLQAELQNALAELHAVQRQAELRPL